MKKSVRFASLLLLLQSPLWAGSGPWTSTGGMQGARRHHSATLLENGRVLVAGGLGPAGTAISTAEIYNPSTGQWSATGSLQTARSYHTATRLADGRVLIAGGQSGGTPLDSVEIYNPQTGLFAAANPLSTARSKHTATRLNDGRVLVAAGLGASGSGAIASAERFSPATGNWTAVGSLGAAREQQTATLLANGRVLVTGGFSPIVAGQFSRLSSTENFDPSNDQWTPRASMKRSRTGHRAIRLANGRVLVVGGAESPGSELYDPAGDSWTSTGTPATNRLSGHSASLLEDGRVVVVGGNRSGGLIETAEIYSPTTGLWLTVAGPGESRAFHSATLLPGGLLLVAGGLGPGSTTLASAEVFQAPDPPAPSLLLYPQLALGGGFRIILFITHQSEGTWNGQVKLNGGAWPTDRPWSLDGVNRTGESQFPVSLGPQQTRQFTLNSSGGPFDGWLEIEGDPGSEVENLATAFFYNYFVGGELDASAGVSPSERRVAFRFPVEQRANLGTGLAVRRSGELKFSLYDQAGNLVQTVELPFQGAAFVSDIFNAAPQNFVGSVKVESGVGFYLVVLRQEIVSGFPDVRFQLTSIPATPVP